MAYLNKIIICKCCGRQYKAKILGGFYRKEAGDLDFNPHNPEIFDKVVQCPYCGYSTININKEQEKNIRTIVSWGENYVVDSYPEVDATAKRLLMSAYISKVQGDYKESGDCYLLAYWYLRDYFANKNSEKVLGETIKQYYLYLKTHKDIPAALLLVDLYRQAGSWEEAEELIEYLQNFTGPEQKLVLKLQKNIIKKLDKKSHSWNEVNENELL